MKINFNTNKIKAIKNKIQIVADNLAYEIRLNRNKLEELEKLTLQSYHKLNDNEKEHIATTGLEEMRRIRNQCKYLLDQKNILENVVKM